MYAVELPRLKDLAFVQNFDHQQIMVIMREESQAAFTFTMAIEYRNLEYWQEVYKLSQERG